ncbi:MAG TPA: hypothetical protein VJA46_02740 [Acidimicrobiia bacterium]|nr:hypothetical protein [Acidimicrobiia bacterium]
MSLVHAEYLKISRRKLYPVMVVILGFLVALTAFFLLIFGQIAPELAEDVPVLTKPGAYLLGAQQVAGQTWFPLILAVVLIGADLSSTVWATSLTRHPSKPAHIGARILVIGVASWVAMLLGTAGWAAVVAIASPGEGNPSVTDWLDVVWKVGVIQVAWVAIGMGAIAMLRSVGPAIGAAIAFSFAESILAIWDPYQNVSLSAATNGLFGVDIGGTFGSFVPGSDLSQLHAIVIIVGWALLGLGLTWWGLQRRDA